MVDIESITELLGTLEDYLDRLKVTKGKVFLEDLESNWEILDAVKYDLQVCVQCCIDIGNHLVASLGLGSPESYGDIFARLGNFGILPAEFVSTLEEMARFRNILVHLYWKVDVKEIFDVLQNNLGDFDKFSKLIVNFVETQESDKYNS